MAKEYREIQLNAAQMMAFFVLTVLRVKKLFLEWGRGTGKSFFLAYCIKKAVKQMPGASFVLVGSTYQQILARTWPSTKEGLEILGIYNNVDYVVGKNGAKYGFKPPIQEPEKWDNVIHFSNGAILQLVSLDSPNSGRGLNAYGVFGDEVALFDPEKLYYNVKTTNRGFKAIFKNKSMLGCEIYASSTPLTKKGQWFTDMEKVCAANSGKMQFIKASSLINKHNLRKGWHEEMKSEAPSELIYNAEILNIRPAEITNGFYPQLNAKTHYYTSYDYDYLESNTSSYDTMAMDCRIDTDVDKDAPLIISIDWGLFLSAVVSQGNTRKYKTLKSFWVDQPKDITNLVEDICTYYAYHSTKIIRLYYGHDGNQKSKINYGSTYGDELAQLFIKHGWKVNDKSKHRPAFSHDLKFRIINAILKGDNTSLPVITINEPNNPDLILSLERAEAEEGPNGIQKIKKDERNKSLKQQHTTHLSDAWDIPICEMYVETYHRLNQRY